MKILFLTVLGIPNAIYGLFNDIPTLVLIGASLLGSAYLGACWKSDEKWAKENATRSLPFPIDRDLWAAEHDALGDLGIAFDHGEECRTCHPPYLGQNRDRLKRQRKADPLPSRPSVETCDDYLMKKFLPPSSDYTRPLTQDVGYHLHSARSSGDLGPL